MMNPTLSLLFVAALALFPVSQSVRELKLAEKADLISRACARTPNRSVCESTLRANPHSQGATLAGLGLIMVGSVEAEANEAIRFIQDLVAEKDNSTALETLATCSHLYTTVAEADVPEAKEAMRTGNYKFAEQGMSDAVNEAGYCESLFANGTSPLTDVNTVIHDRASVASSIARMLLI